MTRREWPSLDLAGLPTTMETLHLWTQVVGKVKIACLPWLNQSWHVPLYVSVRGLSSGLVVTDDRAFEMTFDLRAAELRLDASDGASSVVELVPGSVASFYSSVLDALGEIGVDAPIHTLPSEIAGAVPFPLDEAARAFDVDVAREFWRALIQVQRVFHRFRSRFVGKCSPIHFFWGSFDLAVTRFSGRPAPVVTTGGPGFPAAAARDAYAQEQVGCGFWPGGGAVEEPAFYVEAWPAPPGFAHVERLPDGARFVEQLGEWVLPYSVVRANDDPDALLLAFLQGGYDAVADGGGWDRSALERPEGPIGRPPL